MTIRSEGQRPRPRLALPLALAASAAALAASAQPGHEETPAGAREVEIAKKLAGDDLTGPLFLCKPGGSIMVRQIQKDHIDDWLPPTQVFDNLYYIGTPFVGVYVLKTSAGLILFDSGISVPAA